MCKRSRSSSPPPAQPPAKKVKQRIDSCTTIPDTTLGEDSSGQAHLGTSSSYQTSNFLSTGNADLETVRNEPSPLAAAPANIACDEEEDAGRSHDDFQEDFDFWGYNNSGFGFQSPGFDNPPNFILNDSTLLYDNDNVSPNTVFTENNVDLETYYARFRAPADTQNAALSFELQATHGTLERAPARTDTGNTHSEVACKGSEDNPICVDDDDEEESAPTISPDNPAAYEDGKDGKAPVRAISHGKVTEEHKHTTQDEPSTVKTKTIRGLTGYLAGNIGLDNGWVDGLADDVLTGPAAPAPAARPAPTMAQKNSDKSSIASPKPNALKDLLKARQQSKAESKKPVDHPSPADATPDEQFDADISVNSIRIGTLTEEKLCLATKTLDASPDELFLNKIGKRVLRISAYIGYGGFKIKLPKSRCKIIEITYTQENCRAKADGKIFFNEDLAYKEARDKVSASIAGYASLRNAAPPSPNPENEHAVAYAEWETLANARLNGLDAEGISHHKTITKFPVLPRSVRQCTKPLCTLKDERGVQRFYRSMRECKHDLEQWFLAAAGGEYNRCYEAILHEQSEKWRPGHFELPNDDAKNKKAREFYRARMDFRRKAGELSKNAFELLDELPMKRNF